MLVDADPGIGASRSGFERRSCAAADAPVGWTVSVRTPIAVVICLSVLATSLRLSRVPALETKNAAERGVGQSRSRSAA